MIGIGDKACSLSVFIGNRPPINRYMSLKTLEPAQKGELATIGE